MKSSQKICPERRILWKCSLMMSLNSVWSNSNSICRGYLNMNKKGIQRSCSNIIRLNKTKINIISTLEVNAVLEFRSNVIK